MEENSMCPLELGRSELGGENIILPLEPERSELNLKILSVL